MIDKPTCFVVGAGGSIPYGYPSTAKLSERIRSRTFASLFNASEETLENDLDLYVDGYRHSQLVAALAATRNRYIDQLLAAQPNLRGAAKLALAYEILRCEVQNPECGTENENDDWLLGLFRHLHAGCNDDIENLFSRNPVSFVVFNYDRVVEARLTRLAAAHYGESPDLVWQLFVDHWPVVHVYGQCGVFRSNDVLDLPRREVLTPGVIPFAYFDGAKTFATRKNWLQTASRSLRFVPNERGNEPCEAAVDLLRASERIIFLGFGYDSTNMAKLSPNDWCDKRSIYGTRLGLDDAVCNEINGEWPPPISTNTHEGMMVAGRTTLIDFLGQSDDNTVMINRLGQLQ